MNSPSPKYMRFTLDQAREQLNTLSNAIDLFRDSLPTEAEFDEKRARALVQEMLHRLSLLRRKVDKAWSRAKGSMPPMRHEPGEVCSSPEPTEPPVRKPKKIKA